MRAAYQDRTSQPGLLAGGLKQSVVVVEADLFRPDEIVVLESSRLEDRRA